VHKISDGAMVEYGNPERLVIIPSSRVTQWNDRYEFADFGKRLDATKLYLRDDGQDVVYFNGIPGLTSNMEENFEFLRYFIAKQQPRRVSFMGVSSGGFAANLFAHHVGADDVLLISTLVFMDRNVCAQKGGGERLPGLFDKIHEKFERDNLDPKYLDLRPFMIEGQDKVRSVRMHLIGHDETDLLQAGHVADLPHVRLVPHEQGRHGTLSAILTRSGVLEDELNAPVEQLTATLPANGQM